MHVAQSNPARLDTAEAKTSADWLPSFLSPSMCIRLLCLCVSLLLFSPAAQAKLIPYYRMDSLAFLSDAVVLCEEQSVATRSIQHEGWRETITRVRCRVTQTFKGDLAMGSEFEVEYNSLYSRMLSGDEGGTFLDAKGKVLRVVEPKTLPPGRALLFLRRTAAGALPWEVVSAKLIQGEQVYQFGQFLSNPGGLVLAPQRPENLRLGPAEKYGPAQLIEDLRAALQHAATLKAAVPMNAFDAMRAVQSGLLPCTSAALGLA